MSEGRARPAGGSEPSWRCAGTPGMERVVPRPGGLRAPLLLTVVPGWERGQRERFVRGNEAGFCVWGETLPAMGSLRTSIVCRAINFFPDEVKVRLVPDPAVAAEGGSLALRKRAGPPETAGKQAPQGCPLTEKGENVFAKLRLFRCVSSLDCLMFHYAVVTLSKCVYV